MKEQKKRKNKNFVPDTFYMLIAHNVKAIKSEQLAVLFSRSQNVGNSVLAAILFFSTSRL
jgi:23S rRNA pseudoU1915 N3-methylase RlmH